MSWGRSSMPREERALHRWCVLGQRERPPQAHHPCPVRDALPFLPSRPRPGTPTNDAAFRALSASLPACARRAAHASHSRATCSAPVAVADDAAELAAVRAALEAWSWCGVATLT